MDFFFGAAARDSEEGDQVIDPAQLKYLWTQKLTNTTAGACSSYLAARLLGMGFKYVSDSGLVQSSEFLRHQKQVLIPFAKKALEHLLVQGFVVYGVTPRYKTRGNLASPYVCTSDHFTAKNSHASNGGETLSVTHKGSNKKLYCFVLDSPTSDGTLTSRLALVSKQISYLDEHCAYLSDRILVHASLIFFAYVPRIVCRLSRRAFHVLITYPRHSPTRCRTRLFHKRSSS